MNKRKVCGRIAESTATRKLRTKQALARRKPAVLSRFERKVNTIASLAIEEYKRFNSGRNSVWVPGAYGREDFLEFLRLRFEWRARLEREFPNPMKRRNFVLGLSVFSKENLARSERRINEWLTEKGRQDLKLNQKELLKLFFY